MSGAGDTGGAGGAGGSAWGDPGGMSPDAGLEVVRSFLGCAASRDWSLAESLLDAGVTREGPDRVVMRGRDGYLAHLRSLLGDGVRLTQQVRAMTASADGRSVLVQIDEQLENATERLEASEVMVFGLGGDGRIASIEVYLRDGS